MTIHQITVFLENRPGQLAEITSLLAANQLDIRAISIAETSDYGLVRMIVDDAQKASGVLLEHGAIMSMNSVWAVEVSDKPGGLAALLNALAENNVSVEYMYSLFSHDKEKAYMVLRINDEAAFNEALAKNGLKPVGMEELGLK